MRRGIATVPVQLNVSRNPAVAGSRTNGGDLYRALVAAGGRSL